LSLGEVEVPEVGGRESEGEGEGEVEVAAAAAAAAAAKRLSLSLLVLVPPLPPPPLLLDFGWSSDSQYLGGRDREGDRWEALCE